MNAKGPQTKRLTISPNFFKKERDNYADWAEAFWRELIQNAVDAGSKNIWITTSQEGKNSFVGVDDDGVGMTREVMENVYFSLGETTKFDDKSIGGFGRARILTCFAHNGYELLSKDWSVHGQGSEYTVSDSPQRDKGLLVRVEVNATDRFGDVVDMKKALARCLSKAQLSCKVFVNGELWTGWCHKRRLVKTLSFGNVHTNNNGAWKHRLIVRVQGVPMFSCYIQASEQVIVEIDPKKWREVLLSNRDGLASGASDELHAFIQILAVDKRSALRRHVSSTKLFGPRPLSTSRKSRLPKTEVDIEQIAKKNALELDVAASIAAMSLPTRDKAPPAPGHIDEEIYEEPDTERLDDLIGSAMVYTDTQNPKMRAVLAKYDPTTWKVTEWKGRPGKPYMVGRRRLNLLRLWTAACDEILQIFLEMIGKDEIFWIPGFCFSDDSQALHKMQGDAHALLFCPVDENGKMRFHLSQKSSLCHLILDATHEIVHTWVSPHDENYANILTDLAAKVMAAKNAIFCRFKKVLAREKKS